MATRIEAVPQAPFERLDVRKAAISFAFPNRLAVASDFEDAADSRRERHLTDIGPERRKQFLRELGRAQKPPALGAIADHDPWSEVAHQGLLKASSLEWPCSRGPQPARHRTALADA